MNAPQKQEIGRLAEEIAECYLIEQGLQLVERNFRSKTGEIDLIMRDKDSVVFVEVRCRKSALFGGAAASVDRKKQMKLIRTAQYYLMSHAAAANKPCRFDVIAMQKDHKIHEQQWIKNAFGL